MLDAKKGNNPYKEKNDIETYDFMTRNTKQTEYEQITAALNKQSEEVHELLMQIKQLLDSRYKLIEASSKSNSINDVKQVELDIFHKTSHPKIFLNQLNYDLEKSYYKRDLKINDIAYQLGLSIRQINCRLKKIRKMTLSRYLSLFRLQKAKNLLRKGCKPNQVSLEVGFSSHAYFAQCFKAEFGITPSQYHSVVSGKKTPDK